MRMPCNSAGPSRGGVLAVSAAGPPVVRPQDATVARVLVPADVARVGLGQPHLPLLRRERAGAQALPLAGAAVEVHPRVPGVLQDAQDAAEGRLHPGRLAGPGARPQPHRQPEARLPELADHLPGGCCPLEPPEQVLDRLPDLPVGVQVDPAVGVVDQSGRQWRPQLAAAGLVQLPAVEPDPQEVQLGLAHRAAHAQDQPVVELVRVVQAVLVEDQGVGQGADLQQAVPVRRVAGQPRHLQAEHDPDLPQADVGHQPLEAGAAGGLGARLAQVVVDDHDLVGVPAQGDRLVLEAVLPPRALGVLLDLEEGRLADVEISLSRQMAGGDLVVEAHEVTPMQRETTVASTGTTSARPTSGPGTCGAADPTGIAAVAGPPWARWPRARSATRDIQPNTPWCASRACS